MKASYAKPNIDLLHDQACGFLQGCGKFFRRPFMYCRTALLVAQSDHQHFAQPALQRPHKIGMQLHTVDWNHHVSTQRFTVKIDRKPVLQVTNTSSNIFLQLSNFFLTFAELGRLAGVIARTTKNSLLQNA